MKTSYGIEKCTDPYEVMTVTELSRDAFRLTSQDAVRVSSLAFSYELVLLSFSPNQHLIWRY